MKQILSILLLILGVTVQGQNTNNHVIAGSIDSIHSKILNEKRKIWVYLPNSNPQTIYAHQRYPVVYLLDGDAHFYSVMGMIQQLSEVNGNSVCPQMIVVGILNTDRTRDLTPTHVAGGPYLDSVSSSTSGGGENFTAFLEKELIPHIDSLYPTAPYRMLIGHSFGGLMAVNILINHPGIFNSYLAIDPSLWWDNQKLLRQAATVLQQNKFKGKSLFVGVANTMKPGMDTLQVRNDTSLATLHIRSILEFITLLKKNAANGLHADFKYYNDDDHGSVPLIAEYDALHFTFRNYRLPSFQNLLDSSFNADSAITVHFKNVSVQMGYDVLPPEPLINQLGYTFLQNKMPDKAYLFFEKNIRNYPGSFNAYDSMGDFYDAKANTKKAIEYYSKALKLNDNPETKAKLKKLQLKKT